MMSIEFEHVRSAILLRVAVDFFVQKRRPPTQTELTEDGLLNDFVQQQDGLIARFPYARFSGGSQIQRAAADLSRLGFFIPRGGSSGTTAGRVPYEPTPAGVDFAQRNLSGDWREWPGIRI